jgi:membrane fusion protein, macrolide-specific efflux system
MLAKADALQIAEATRKSALAQRDSIETQIQQTESTLRGDAASLGYTKIYAPITGTVVSQAAKQGQTLNANQQAPIIMRLADLSTMTVSQGDPCRTGACGVDYRKPCSSQKFFLPTSL